VSQTPRTITMETARRLAVSRQRLAGPRPGRDAEGILEIARDLGCLQLDPTGIVDRSHRLVLWSRLGPYDTGHLDALLWERKELFEYWAHAASLVLTEDYPIHRHLMRIYGTKARHEKLRDWIAENDQLRRYILKRIREAGPLRTRDLEDISDVKWPSSGWNDDRNVDRMLDYLLTKGRIMVVGRPGGLKLWDLARRWLPDWTPRERLSEVEVTRRSAERSLRALGVATPGHIQLHLTRNRYPGFPAVKAWLERTGRLVPIRIVDEGQTWPGPWFIHAEDLPLVDRLEAGEWEPRTTLLSPFDNLICDRARTDQLFGFRFRIEIYVPKDKRVFGYYVLPILQGDRLIGRVDPAMDRVSGRLTINSVHMEPTAPGTVGTGRAVAAAVEELGAFLGAKEIEYAGAVPERWSRALR
jgi:uncharacterized protein YcaQ